MEIEVTWNRVIRIWWAYAWRNIIAIIGAMVIAGLIGAVIGMLLGMLKVDKTVITAVSMVIGACIGVIASFFPIKLILGKDFGDFKLAIIAKS